MDDFEVDAEGCGVLDEELAVAAVDPDLAQGGVVDGGLMVLNQQIDEVDKLVEARFRGRAGLRPQGRPNRPSTAASSSSEAPPPGVPSRP
ncbi:hypothetical protein [Streptomyces sp. Root369]|uniref:hypothetical protein n=1 Tax=Streptomyces sp. Root369 TaxID=1736523 RepID=UPI00070BC531|nr:hypothetical protein [Streptomyces sp. Root369]KQW03306.1 hypothetical protein ASD08_44175 [Streptomyces sp. Root369]